MAEYSSPIRALGSKGLRKKQRDLAEVEEYNTLPHEVVRKLAGAKKGEKESEEAVDRNPLNLLMGGPTGAMFLGGASKFAPIDRITRWLEMTARGVNPEAATKATSAGGRLPGIYAGYEGKPRWEITDTPARIRPGLREGRTYAAEEVVEHPELFANLPDLRGVPVKVTERSPVNAGAYLPDSDKIEVYGLRGPERDLQTLIHELTHGTQKREGFVGGTSPEGIRQALGEKITSNVFNMMMMRSAADKQGGDALGRLFSSPDYQALRKENDRLTGVINDDELLHKLYLANPGEAEANNAAKIRLKWAMSQRAREPGYMTEPVPRAAQILIE